MKPLNKIHVFDTTVVRGRGMHEKLVNLYKMKSIVMFGNFIAKEVLGNEISKHHYRFQYRFIGNEKPHLTFHRNTEWMKMTATPHY